MLKIDFKVIEIRKGGVTVTHYLRGTRKEIKKDIEAFKETSSDYELLGKKGMVVWA